MILFTATAECGFCKKIVTLKATAWELVDSVSYEHRHSTSLLPDGWNNVVTGDVVCSDHCKGKYEERDAKEMKKLEEQDRKAQQEEMISK